MEGLKEFIKNGETKEALSLLLNHVSDEVLINELLMLNSRLAELESFNRKGILSYDEYSRQKNAINNSILEIYKKHTTPSTHFVFKKRAKPLFYIVTISILFSVVIYNKLTKNMESDSSSNHTASHRVHSDNNLWAVDADSSGIYFNLSSNDISYNHPPEDWNVVDMGKSASENHTSMVVLPENLSVIEYFKLGVSYRQNKNFNAAILHLSKAILDSTNFSFAYIERGLNKRISGDYEGAMDDYSKALEINPNMPIVYLNRSIIFFLIKDYQNAETDCKKALALNANLPQAYNNLGNIMTAQNKFKEAVGYYNRALQIKPYYKNALYGMGVASFYLKDFAKACSSFKLLKDLRFDKPISTSYLLKCN